MSTSTKLSTNQKGSPREAGLAPILIVLLIAVTLGSYFVYKKTSIPVKTPTPSPLADQSSPTPQLSSTSTPKPADKKVVTSRTSPTPTPSPSPAPSTSPSPTTKPSPVSGVYQLDLQPSTNIETTTSARGYGISALLKDSNGDYIQDLTNFTFSWSIENPAIADLNISSWGSIERTDCFSYEPYNIKAPCPALRAEIAPKSSGSTIVKVKVTTKPDNKQVAEGAFSLTIK